MFEAVFSCCVHTGFSVGILAGDTLQWTGSGTTKLNIINDMIYAHKTSFIKWDIKWQCTKFWLQCLAEDAQQPFGCSLFCYWTS